MERLKSPDAAKMLMEMVEVNLCGMSLYILFYGEVCPLSAKIDKPFFLRVIGFRFLICIYYLKLNDMFTFTCTLANKIAFTAFIISDKYGHETKRRFCLSNV